MASITASATTVKVGDLVNFSAQSSDATSGTSGQYTWVFGDNTANGAGANTSHTYTQAGTYSAKVSTTYGAGNTGEGTQVITVNPPADRRRNRRRRRNDHSAADEQLHLERGGWGWHPEDDLRWTRRSWLPRPSSSGRDIESCPCRSRAAVLEVERYAFARGKAFARGAATFTRAGRFGFKLKLPAKLKPGSYKLNVKFKPKGSSHASSKTLKIRFVAAAKSSAVRAAAHSPFLAR